MIRVSPAAADGYRYKRKGTSDDGVDDGANSLTSRLPPMANERGLRPGRPAPSSPHRRAGWISASPTQHNQSMRIFLAGATGVIGVHLVPRLVAAGHTVAGMTRSPDKVEQ